MNTEISVVIWMATLLLLSSTVFLNVLKKNNQALLTGWAALLTSMIAFFLVIIESGHLPMSGTFEKMQNIVLIIVGLGIFNRFRMKEKRIYADDFWVIALIFQSLIFFDELKTDEFFYLYDNVWVALFFQFRLISMAFVAYALSLYISSFRFDGNKKTFILKRAGFYTLAAAILFLSGEFSGSFWAQLAYGDAWRWSKNFFNSGSMFLLTLVASHLHYGWIKTANRQAILSIIPLIMILVLFIL